MIPELQLSERNERGEVDAEKREFMKKFGKYAATAPMGMYLLMGPGASKAQASGTACSVRKTIYFKNFCGDGQIDFDAMGKSQSIVVNADVKADWYKDNWKITKFGDGTYSLHSDKYGTISDPTKLPVLDLGPFGTFTVDATEIIDKIFKFLGC